MNKITPKKKRASLSREKIIDASIDYVDQYGFESFSLRNIAKHMGSGVMSTYAYFDTKEALLSTILDRIIRDMNISDHDEADWREWMIETYVRIYNTYMKYPDALPLYANAMLTGDEALKVLEDSLRVMKEGGLNTQQALECFYTLSHYTQGIAMQRAAMRRLVKKGDMPDIPKQIQNKKQESRYPYLLEHFDSIVQYSGVESYSEKVRWIVSVLANQFSTETKKG